MEHYSAMTRNEILPFVATWMDTEGIINEVRETKTNTIIPYDLTYTWNLKKKKAKFVNRRDWWFPDAVIGGG